MKIIETFTFSQNMIENALKRSVSTSRKCKDIVEYEISFEILDGKLSAEVKVLKK